MMTRMWTFRAAVTAIACFAATCVEGATIAHWDFEEGTVGALATAPGSITDSANGLNGSPVDDPLYVSSTVPGSKVAVKFDAWLARISIPDDPLLALTKSLTLEAAVRPIWPSSADPLGGIVVIRGGVDPGLDPYLLRIRQDMRLEFIINGDSGGEATLVSPAPLSTDGFQQVAGSLDDATGLMRLFVQGIEVAEMQTEVRPIGALDPDSAPGVGIGALGNGGQYFNGRIDDVRISDTALAPKDFLYPPTMGDANGDRLTDGADYTVWADHFLQTGHQRWSNGDFSGDGYVDGADYVLWADNFSPAPLTRVMAVPEPAASWLAAIGAEIAILGKVFRRKYRNA